MKHHGFTRICKGRIGQSGVPACFFVVLIAALLFAPALLFAQQPSEEVFQQEEKEAREISKAIELLPASKEGANPAVTLNAANVSAYQILLLPEILQLVRDEKLQVKAARTSSLAWRVDDEWEKPAVEESGVSVDAHGVLGGVKGLRRGLLFGGAAVLEQEPDPRLRGAKIVWNISSNWWSQKVIWLDLRLAQFARGAPGRSLAGELFRVYPAAIDPADPTGQIFREKLKVKTPAPLAGMSWLAFRFFGAEEDVFWAFSPAIGKARQLTGFNRGDPLLHAGLSLDDIFGWSAKNEIFEARFDRELIALAPFPRGNPAIFSASEGGCFKVEERSSRTAEEAARWNGETNEFPGGAPWWPSQVLFVPRKLWRVELVPLDSFSLYGRQVLFVDAASMLPLYKLAYDRAGDLAKIVISAFGIAASPSVSDARVMRVPYSLFTVAYDRGDQAAYTFDYRNIRYCGAVPNTIAPTEFDPYRLGPPPPEPKKGSGKTPE